MKHTDKRYTPTPPVYDEVYFKGMEWLDKMASGEIDDMIGFDDKVIDRLEDTPRSDMGQMLEMMAKHTKAKREALGYKGN